MNVLKNDDLVEFEEAQSPSRSGCGESDGGYGVPSGGIKNGLALTGANKREGSMPYRTLNFAFKMQATAWFRMSLLAFCWPGMWD